MYIKSGRVNSWSGRVKLGRDCELQRQVGTRVESGSPPLRGYGKVVVGSCSS